MRSSRLCPGLAALFLGLFLALTASEVHAQTRDDVAAGVSGLLNVDFRLGPFYIEPGVSLRGGYESVTNVREDDGSVPLDLLLRPGGFMRIVLPVRERHEFYARGRAEYVWYNEYRGLSAWDTTVNLGYEYDSERFRFEISDNFFWGRRGAFSPGLEEGVDLDPQYDIVANLKQKTNEIRSRMELTLAPRLTIAPTGGFRRVRYQEDDEATTDVATSEASRRLDRDEWFVGGAIRFQVNPIMTWATEYEYTDSEFTDPTNIRNGWNDRVGLRVEYNPHERFSANIFGGFRRFRPVREDDSFEGFSGTADVRIVPGGRLEIQLQGERDPRLAFFANNSHFLRQGGQLRLLYAVSRRLKLGGDGSFYNHGYPVAVPVLSADDSVIDLRKRSDDLFTYAGRIEWALNRRGEIQIRAGQFRRTSNFPGFDLDGLIVQAGYAFTY